LGKIENMKKKLLLLCLITCLLFCIKVSTTSLLVWHKMGNSNAGFPNGLARTFLDFYGNSQKSGAFFR
jgi:hypothetical protein